MSASKWARVPYFGMRMGRCSFALSSVVVLTTSAMTSVAVGGVTMRSGEIGVFAVNTSYFSAL
jgi:hypothetical protein